MLGIDWLDLRRAAMKGTKPHNNIIMTTVVISNEGKTPTAHDRLKIRKSLPVSVMGQSFRTLSHL